MVLCGRQASDGDQGVVPAIMGEMLDLPRMAESGPSLQCFTLYTPADRTGEAATAYAMRLHELWTRGDRSAV